MVCHVEGRANSKTLKQKKKKRAFYVRGKEGVPMWLEHDEQGGGEEGGL